MIRFLLLFLLSFNLAAQDAKYLDKDTPAPYNGFLFTVSKTKSIRKELIEKDQLKIFNQALQENIKAKDIVITNQKEEVKILVKQNEKLAKQIDTDKSMSNFEKVIWFALGVTAAGFAVYGAKQIVK